MSALGQKRTFAPQKVMSALPPKADVCGAPAHVCFTSSCPRQLVLPICRLVLRANSVVEEMKVIGRNRGLDPGAG